MKKLGLIGGIGPESTIPYYRDIVYGLQERVGRKYFPNLIVESLNVFDIFRFCEQQDYQGLVKYLLVGIRNLAAGGAEVAALTGNTPHIVFNELQMLSPIRLVSIIETARDEARRRNFRKVGLLGTIFTMNGEFFKRPFESAAIQVVTPTETEQLYANDKIARELELGVAAEDTRNGFLRIVERMQSESGIEAVVLGCTELPLLFKGAELPIACLDTMRIHIDALIDLALED